MPEIRVLLDQDRVLDEITVEEYLGLQDRDMRVIMQIFSRFVVDENDEFVSPEEGWNRIRKLSMRQLGELTNQLMEGVENGVPKGNAVD